MTVRISPSADKQLRSLSKFDQIIVIKKIKTLVDTNLRGSEKLKGYQNIHRIRVGSFRIVFRKIPNEIYIVLIGHRKDVYENLRRLLK